MISGHLPIRKKGCRRNNSGLVEGGSCPGPECRIIDRRSDMKYWFILFVAIIAEVTGTLAMKYGSETGNYLGLAAMFVMITTSYWLLAIAIKRIPLAVAYGTWESIGLVLIAVFSFLLFGESLGILKILAIALIISGILLMERNTISSGEEEGG